MKTKTLFSIAILLIAAGTALAGDQAIFSAGVSYLQPADSGYRDVYGGRAFYPEFQAGARLVRGLYLMAGFGFLTKKGQTPELELPAKSTQRFFTAGLAYIVEASRNLKFKVEAGVADFSYKEEAMETTVSGSKLGYQAEIGLLVFKNAIFTGVNLGYMYATDMVGDVKIKLGGARASLCIGVRI
jgi:hypothetical protein